MRVTLVRCPTLIDPSASTSPITPPLGLAYLHAVVATFTDDIVIIDSIGNAPTIRPIPSKEFTHTMLLGQTDEEIACEVPQSTQIILFSCMFSQDWPYARKIIGSLRARAKDAVIIGGGEHFTAAPRFSLRSAPELDLLVLGEGEATLSEILTRFKNSESLENIPNTLSQRAEYTPTRDEVTVRKSRIKDLDKITRPLWDKFPLQKYFDGSHTFGVNLGRRTMPIMASRGCPYRCTFCSSPDMWSTSWHVRRPEDVIAEIRHYQEHYGANNFDFYDLTAIVKRRWIISFCEQIIGSGLDITWQLPSGTRSEAIDEEVASLLYQSGCRNLSYAPESGSPRVLSLIKKRIDVNNMLTSMKACVTSGLSVKANLMCGFPGETHTDLWKSYIFALRAAVVGIDDISVNQFSPYPGSELFRLLIAQGQIKLDEQYFRQLSYYSSMTKSTSYSEYISPRMILFFKYFLTMSFYTVHFLARPKNIPRVWQNVREGKETTRLEKTLIAYLARRRTPVNS